MFMLTIRTLFRNYGQRPLNYGMIAVACSLFLLSTAVSIRSALMYPTEKCPEQEYRKQEMVVNVARLYKGFISMGPTLPGGPEEYFAFSPSSGDPLFLIKSCLYNTQTVILDAVVVSLRSTFPVVVGLSRHIRSTGHGSSGITWQ